MLKLLIAEGTEELRLALADNLRGAYIIRMCGEGNETMELLRTFKPDVMVLDLLLPGLDGISLLQRAAAAGHKPMVLAVTRFLSDYMLESLADMGVGYVMRKPCDVKAVADRLMDLTGRLKQPAPAQPDPWTVVSNMLLSLGISTKLHGYAYLRDAILARMRRPGQMVTKELYPDVGKPYNASKEQVERSIRSAIEKAWEKRDEKQWRLYFGETASRPTNGEFISCLADRVLMSREGEPLEKMRIAE